MTSVPAVFQEVQVCFVGEGGWDLHLSELCKPQYCLCGVSAGVICIGYLPDSLVKFTQMDIPWMPSSCHRCNILASRKIMKVGKQTFPIIKS